jgi:hypothetical protein
MTFSIIHPSIRPHKWKEIYEAWIAAAAHPENVEYILVADEKWGFVQPKPEDGREPEWPAQSLHDWQQQRLDYDEDDFAAFSTNILLWNPGKSCWVTPVNIGAKAATGDVLIVVADDIWPAEHWDEVLAAPVNTKNAELRRTELEGGMPWRQGMTAPANLGEFAIWVNNGGSPERRKAIAGTPGQGVMEMPVVSRSRVERLGYLLYPGYEGMYADEDLARHCEFDAKEGTCSLIKLEEPVFPHKHPINDPAIVVDEQYKHQNRPQAYALGRRILAARKANGFSEVVEGIHLKRRIAVCVAGGPFAVAWLKRWTELLELAQRYDLEIVFNFAGTNVYHMRFVMAQNILSLGQLDYVLWLDDDQLVSIEQVEQLIADLDGNSDVDMVAGWTRTGVDVYPTALQLSCGFEDREITPKELLGVDAPELREVDYTGFPLVLMRGELLRALGPEGFLPVEGHPTFVIYGEDVSFCLRARKLGKKICVDRRVGPLPHLKLRDIAAGVLG